jgi:hypothetical protein
MIRRVITLIGIYILTLSSTAWAEAGWTDEVKIIELIPTNRHYFEVHLAGSKNPSGCREEGWFYINYDARGTDKMFDLFVDSIKTELRLRVYVTGICNLKGYAEISSVSVSPE